MSSKKIREREVRLKTLMLKKGIKGIDIAEGTKLSKAMVSMYLKGERNSPKIDRYFRKLKEKK